MKIILIDEYFHEKEVDFKFCPNLGSILEVELEKNKGRSKFKIIGCGNKSLKNEIIPTLHLKYIGRTS